MALTLKIFTHVDGGTDFVGERVLEGERITVGRSAECSLRLDDPQKMLSRVHVAFEAVAGGYQLRGLSAHYGVQVNGKEHAPGSQVKLAKGDSVVMDKYELEIVDTGEEESDPDATVARRPAVLPPAPPAPAARAAPSLPGPSAPVAAPAPRANAPAPIPPRAATPAPSMSIPAGLSATRLADLPGAGPYQTELGSDNPSVQIASLQVGHVLAGRFRVQEQIGAGGMGAVYRALDELRGEDIALKVMLPGLLASEQAKQRFMNEAKIALQLRHPGVVSVHDVQADGAYLFLTMELLRGRTLRHAMEERKQSGQRWTEAEALGIIRPLCEALAYAHQYTVHRDVKPENVWLGEDGTVKIMDFGIARVLTGSQMTQTAAVMGTAYYMAPEQLAGVRDVDHRADQYALGVMLYEMLTGRIPAGRIESLGVVREDASAALSEAVDKALSGRVEQRYATDAEFLSALNAPAVGAGASKIKALGRRVGFGGLPVKMIGAGAAALAGVLVLFLLWPVMKGLFPDKEAEARTKLEAARLDGEARSLMKLIDNDRRESKEAVATASRDVDRLEGQARSARTPAERAVLDKALLEARDKARVSAALDAKLRERIEGPGGLTKVEGALNAASEAMKGRNRGEGLKLLGETVASLTALRTGFVEDRKVVLAEQQRVVEQRHAEEQQLAEARAKADAEARVRAVAAAKVAAERQAKEREEAAARAKVENAARAAMDADSRARAEAEARVRSAAQEKARTEAAERSAAAAERAAAAAEARAKADQQRQGLEMFMGIMRGLAR